MRPAVMGIRARGAPVVLGNMGQDLRCLYHPRGSSNDLFECFSLRSLLAGGSVQFRLLHLQYWGNTMKCSCRCPACACILRSSLHAEFCARFPPIFLTLSSTETPSLQSQSAGKPEGWLQLVPRAFIVPDQLIYRIVFVISVSNRGEVPLLATRIPSCSFRYPKRRFLPFPADP